MLISYEISGLFQELQSKNFQLFLCKLAKHRQGNISYVKRYNKLFNITYTLKVKLNNGHLRIFYTNSYGLEYCFGFDKMLTKPSKLYDTERVFNIPTVFATLMNFRWYASSYDKSYYEQIRRSECKNVYKYV